jgi:hypothetical protein
MHRKQWSADLLREYPSLRNDHKYETRKVKSLPFESQAIFDDRALARIKAFPTPLVLITVPTTQALMNPQTRRRNLRPGYKCGEIGHFSHESTDDSQFHREWWSPSPSG